MWKNNFDTSFRDFAIVTEDGNTSYIVLFIVSRLSALIQLSISGLFVVIGKPVKSAYLGIVKHDWTSFVYWRANRRPFLPECGNIWNSKVEFYNKTTGCWGTDVSIETYELLLLFNIISPWCNQAIEDISKCFSIYRLWVKTHKSVLQQLIWIWNHQLLSHFCLNQRIFFETS